jgi:uncharacterized damage-inducible protein DinB
LIARAGRSRVPDSADHHPIEETIMKKAWSCTLALVAGTIALASIAHADHHELTGVRKEMKASIDDAGGKLIELAEATPAAKFAWKPGKDVRTTGEVFLHVVAANYGIPMFMGAAPDPNAPVTRENFGTFEKSTTDKAKIVAMLKESFAYADRVIAATADADLDAPVKLFGMDTTKRGALFIIVNHAHEHLGQSIAYARTNNITPPWTAREQAAAAKKQAEAKGAAAGSK